MPAWVVTEGASREGGPRSKRSRQRQSCGRIGNELGLDSTPPEAECLEGANPHGKTMPKAPGNGGQGQNQDGFYELVAADDVWPAEGLGLFVLDSGSGTVFGPFEVGTVIKYTEGNGAVPKIMKIGSGIGQAGAVSWHIIGNGDAVLSAVDGSGNVSAYATCLVPPPPK